MSTTLPIQLSDAAVEDFGRELDAIADEIKADLGERDARYIRRLIKIQRGLALGGRLVIFASLTLLLGVPQPKVSALTNYRLDQFAVERLMQFLTALNQDVEIMIRPRANKRGTGHISVLAVP